MEDQLSDILDNLLGLLLLEGSYEIEEDEDNFQVEITTPDAGRLIGARGESLDSLQLLVNLMMLRKVGSESKRVVIDVEGWRKKKEAELSDRARGWAERVKESGQEMELEPMAPWQRRAIHMAVQEIAGVESESIGEGRDRRLIIRPAAKKVETKSKKSKK